MSDKKWVVDLTEAERGELPALIPTGKALRAATDASSSLLLAGEGRTEEDMAGVLHAAWPTAALRDKGTRTVRSDLDGGREQEWGRRFGADGSGPAVPSNGGQVRYEHARRRRPNGTRHPMDWDGEAGPDQLQRVDPARRPT
jgi:hypothetical protein